ncbi:MAG TPA: hypothetical protein VMB80_09480 [Candidatus Acidoferrum sp.]|nr:hypothetical protein [Candidatus Acidoferrum sp.]
MKTKSQTSQKSEDTPASSRVADLQQGIYSDGSPLDEVHYLECKVILKGERFTSVECFNEFAKLVRKTAAKRDVDFDSSEFEGQRPQIREVLFLDTKDFRLYNNAFILRRRITYQDGFLVGDPEIVFKFRHPDMQKAAEIDVRPDISGDYRVKFKAEALPLKDRIGGYRLLFSHNIEFPLSAVRQKDRTSMATILRVLPALKILQTSPRDRIELVNATAVEEVLLDIGMLDFGKGIEAKSNVAVWRTRGDQKQLVGEFAYQCKFRKRDELHDKAMKRCKDFFCSLQHVASDWVSPGTTKTGAVYRLKGNAPAAHE